MQQEKSWLCRQCEMNREHIKPIAEVTKGMDKEDLLKLCEANVTAKANAIDGGCNPDTCMLSGIEAWEDEYGYMTEQELRQVNEKQETDDRYV